MSASSDGGIRFGQYVLLRRIARGGMAEVFLAQQKGLEGFDRRVAVKRILPHLADAPDFVQMFLGEARLAAQLSHPNVVHIYDFGKYEGDYFIAMEFVDGVHAGQLFKHGEQERMPPTMVARIGADAATALHYAHELRGPSGKPIGLVHRDVSPANLMVSFDGVVKLCDFGIAKAALLGDQLTNPGQVKGKYAYMSPEQTIAAPLDGRSDVFSLSIVLWELLTGKTIVGRGDAVEAMRAIRDGKLPPLEKVAPRTPPALVKAITWGLQTRRETRATAMDFAQALEQFIKGSPELATPMQLGAWVRQRFARAATGQHDAIPGVSIGTRVAPGTSAGSHTGAVDAPRTRAGMNTPAVPETGLSGLASLASSQVHSLDDDVEDDDAGDDLDHAETVALGPAAAARQIQAASTTALAASHATVLAPPGPNTGPGPGPRAASQPTQLASPTTAGRAAPRATDTVNETSMRSGAFRPQVAGGPAELPTMLGPRPPERRNTPLPLPAESTSGFRRRGPRLALAIGGLVGLAILSFVIALAAHSSSKPAARDAGVRSPVIVPAPAPAPDAAAPDALVIDAFTPTIRPDAPDDLTYLEVRTKPGGGMVRIGDEPREDPARFALAPGHYKIVADLDGYKQELREVDLIKGVDLVQEIAFTHRLATGTGPGTHPTTAPGKLTVRTTPYSVVFSGARKLGETPFADLELAPGTYTLTFKHPSHAAVTRKVTITSGKTTKLGFALP